VIGSPSGSIACTTITAAPPSGTVTTAGADTTGALSAAVS